MSGLEHSGRSPAATCPRPGGYLCSKVFLGAKARGNRALPTHRFHAPRAHRPRRSAVSPAPRPNDVFPLGLKDQVAIVTGATSGLGRACAVAFGRAQAAVIVNHLPGDDGTAAEVVREIEREGGRAAAIAAAVSDEKPNRQRGGEGKRGSVRDDL